MSASDVADALLERQFKRWLSAHGIAPMAEYLFRLRDALNEIKRTAVSTTEPLPSRMTVEQMLRDLLTEAIREELVRLPKPGTWGDDPDPQCRSPGELVGTANLLAAFLRGETTEEWEAKMDSIRQIGEESANVSAPRIAFPPPPPSSH